MHQGKSHMLMFTPNDQIISRAMCSCVLWGKSSFIQSLLPSSGWPQYKQRRAFLRSSCQWSCKWVAFCAATNCLHSEWPSSLWL